MRSSLPGVSTLCGGSGNSANRASSYQIQNCNRKSCENEESDCHSDDIETESISVRKTTSARGGTGSKRSRAAEVHNLSERTKQMGRLPVVYFAAIGIVTSANAALMMQLGCDGVFLGTEVLSSANPYKRVRAIVQAVGSYNDPVELAQVSSGLENAMAGLNLSENRVEPFGAANTY